MSELTYYDFAIKSFNSLDEQFKLAERIDWYNLFAPECEQIIEKLMKSILDLCSSDIVPDRLYKTHKLHIIGEFINTRWEGTVDVATVSWIETFYFEARCPGEDSIVVVKDTAEKLKDVTVCEGQKLIDLRTRLLSSSTSFFNSENEEQNETDS